METKNDLLTRLIKEGHITFEEAKLIDGDTMLQPVVNPEPIVFREFHPYEVPRRWDTTPSPYWWMNPPITCGTKTYPAPEWANGTTVMYDETIPHTYTN